VVTKDTYYAHTETKFQELDVLKFNHTNDFLIGNFYFKITNNILPSFLMHTVIGYMKYTSTVLGLGLIL